LVVNVTFLERRRVPKLNGLRYLVILKGAAMLRPLDRAQPLIDFNHLGKLEVLMSDPWSTGILRFKAFLY